MLSIKEKLTDALANSQLIKTVKNFTDENLINYLIDTCVLKTILLTNLKL